MQYPSHGTTFIHIFVQKPKKEKKSNSMPTITNHSYWLFIQLCHIMDFGGGNGGGGGSTNSGNGYGG